MFSKILKSMIAISLIMAAGACSKKGGNSAENKQLEEDLRTFRSSLWCNQDGRALERWSHVDDNTILSDVFQISDSGLGEKMVSMEMDYQMTPESLILTNQERETLELVVVDVVDDNDYITITFDIGNGTTIDVYSCDAIGNPSKVKVSSGNDAKNATSSDNSESSEEEEENESTNSKLKKEFEAMKADKYFMPFFEKPVCKSDSVELYVAEYMNEDSECNSCVRSEKVAIIGTGTPYLTIVKYDQKVPPYKVKEDGKIVEKDEGGSSVHQGLDWRFTKLEVVLNEKDSIMRNSATPVYFFDDYDAIAHLRKRTVYDESVRSWAGCKK